MEISRKHRPALLEVAFHLLVFAAAAWLARAWGPGEDGAFDSAFYVDGARHLALGDGYVGAITEPDQTGFGPIIRWAPGFSLLVSIPMRLGVPVIDAASIVLGLCYASAVTLVGVLGWRVLGRRNWFACLVAAIAFGAMPSTLRSLNLLLSDLPFATFALLSLFLCFEISRARRPHWLLSLGLGACLGFTFLLRYAGALFVPGLLLATLWTMRARKRSFWRACGYLLPCVGTFVAIVTSWIIRNKSFGPDAFGQRVSIEGFIDEQLEAGAVGALSWFTQLEQSFASAPWGTSFLPRLGLTCALLLLPFAWTSAKRSLTLLLVPALAYFAALAAASARVDMDPIAHPRFWVAVWPLTVLAIATVALRTRKRRWLMPLRLGAGVLLAAIAVAFTASSSVSLRTAQQYKGLLSRYWAHSASMLPEPGVCRLFAMDPRPFMLHRELGPTSGIPLSLAEYEAAAVHHPSLCLAVVSERLRLTRSAEQRRPLQLAVVEALRQQGRLETLSRGAGVTVFRVRDARHP